MLSVSLPWVITSHIPLITAFTDILSARGVMSIYMVSMALPVIQSVDYSSCTLLSTIEHTGAARNSGLSHLGTVDF